MTMTSLSLLPSMLAIALVDSLNPSLFVAQFYLLTTRRPKTRILSYILGLLLVNFLGGILILSGARVVIVEFLNSFTPALFYGAQLVLGVVLIVFGLWMRVSAHREIEAKKPRSLHPVHTFLLGMLVMLNEITTALPYFVAIERIAQAQVDAAQGVGLLIFYNLIFSLPLFGFLLLRGRFLNQLERLNQRLQYWMPRIIKYGALVFGGVLAINAGAYLLTGNVLFG